MIWTRLKCSWSGKGHVGKSDTPVDYCSYSSAQLGVQESRPGPQNHRADPQRGKDWRAGGAEESAAAASLQGQQETDRSARPKSSLRLSAIGTATASQEASNIQTHFLSMQPAEMLLCPTADRKPPPPTPSHLLAGLLIFHHVEHEGVKSVTLSAVFQWIQTLLDYHWLLFNTNIFYIYFWYTQSSFYLNTM